MTIAVDLGCKATKQTKQNKQGGSYIPISALCIWLNTFLCARIQGLHRLEKYLNLEGFLEKSLKIESALKSTGKSLKSLEKSLDSTIFCKT